jgi:uncharacterized membrane protein YciS (DUF1049 family)
MQQRAFGMISRLVWIILLIPAAIILIALSVANRNVVPFTFDPFAVANPYLTVSAPLFAFLFASLIVGLIIGALTTWVAQGKHRRKARQLQIEADQRLAEMRNHDRVLRGSPAIAQTS